MIWRHFLLLSLLVLVTITVYQLACSSQISRPPSCVPCLSRGVWCTSHLHTQQTPRSYHLASTPAACYVTSVPTLPVQQTTKNTLRTPIGMPRPRRQQLTNGSSPVSLPDMSPGASKVQQERLQVKRQRHVLKHRCSACGVTSDSTKAPMMACARCR